MTTWIKKLESLITQNKKAKNPLYHAKFKNDIPELIKEHIIYIIGDRPHYWAILFKCPCGCNETIQLNLLNEANPSWRFSTKWSVVSIYPSIWREVGCKSHFILRKGRIKWCRWENSNF